MNPTIRRAHPHDAAALTALMHASASYRGQYAAILQGYAVTADQVLRDEMHVALSAGRIVGFYSLTRAARDVELDLMFVADDAQGRGIGALLFGHMVTVARAAGACAVRIVSHPPAEAFYRRMGAVPVGTRPACGRVTWPRPVLSLPVPAV